MKTKLLIIIILVSLTVSCKKEVIEPETNEYESIVEGDYYVGWKPNPNAEINDNPYWVEINK